MKNLPVVMCIFMMAALSRAQILTDFENDSLDGWRSEGDGSYYLEVNSGNPGNCMRIDDDATGELNIAIAPLLFTGNWSAADSSDSLTTDVYISLINGTELTDQWAFRISGPGGSATSQAFTPPLGQWHHIAIALDSSQWQMTSGNWQSLIDYINHLEVRAEYINGDEFVRLDNLGLSFSPVPVKITPLILSDFEKGLYEGWTFEQSGGTSIPTSGGNPGRYVRITDGTGLSQALAPPKFLGDWGALDGAAAVQFDLQITNFSGPLVLSDFWIKISGPGGQAVVPMDSSLSTAFSQWKTFSFLIDAESWQLEAGTWEALIADVRELRLIVEYISGSEIIWLDNFRITNSPPLADFIADPLFVFLGQEVSFTDRSLNAPHSWTWEFGDGTVSTDEAPVYQYQQPGIYGVRLTVNNFFGNDMIERQTYIEVAGITDSILFADDFDDNQIHPAWRFRNGSWVEQSQTMIQNSNYYSGSYIGGCFALVGSSQWKNYQLNVDFRSTDNDKIGVVFDYQDAGNFYLFTWQQEGTLRAVKRFENGAESNLAADTVGYQTNQWYRLSVVTEDYSIHVFIDSTEIFSLTDSTFGSGKAGLYCHGNQNSIWDNFLIKNLDYVTGMERLTGAPVPHTFVLDQNYPNPFNPLTTISFQIPRSAFVSLKIYNVLGEEVETLIAADLLSGSYRYQWDASTCATGVYYYQLRTGDLYAVKKMIVLK